MYKKNETCITLMRQIILCILLKNTVFTKVEDSRLKIKQILFKRHIVLFFLLLNNCSCEHLTDQDQTTDCGHVNIPIVYVYIHTCLSNSMAAMT
jgi:hypothetical protein